MTRRALLALLALLAFAPYAHGKTLGCDGVEVKAMGKSEGCVAVVVFGKAEGRIAFAGQGKATGGTIAIVGSGCATQNEEGFEAGVLDNHCGRNILS